MWSRSCGPLDLAGREHIVHRDIKPSNVMITPENRAKVMDFGIAKLPSLAMTTTGTVLGTPYYMSPEQISGQKVDIRSDLFSVGAVLYEMMTGERPFEAENTATLAYKIVQTDPIPAKVLNVHVPEAVAKVIARALAKDPTQRYQTPAEMIQDIRALRSKPVDDEEDATVISKVVDFEETVQMTGKTGAASSAPSREPPPPVSHVRAEPPKAATTPAPPPEHLSVEETVLASSHAALEDVPVEEATVLASSRTGVEKEPEGEATVLGSSQAAGAKAAAKEDLVFSPATVDLPPSARQEASHYVDPFEVPPPPPGTGAEKADTGEKKKSREPAAETPKAAPAGKATTREPASPGGVPPRTGKAGTLPPAQPAAAKSGGGNKAAVIVILLVLAGAAGVYYYLSGPSGPAVPTTTTQSAAPSTTQPPEQPKVQAQPEEDRTQIAAKVEGLLAEAKKQWQANPKAAQEALMEALRLDPNSFDAAYQYGRFLTQWKDYTAAIQQYETALRLNGRAPEVYFNLGYIYLAQGNFDSAIFNFESCRALNPSYQDEVLANLGIVYLKKGDAVQAQDFFRKSLELNPGNTVARNYAAAASATTVPTTQPPVTTTVPAPETTVAPPPATAAVTTTTTPPVATTLPSSAADPTTAEVTKPPTTTTSETPTERTTTAQDQPVLTADELVAKGKAQMQSDPAVAQKLLEDAVNRDPSHFEANYQLARLLTQKKEYPTAVQYYLSAQRIKSRAPEIYFNLGYVYTMQGELELARMNYESCLALSPPYRDEVLTNLGIIQLKKKNLDEARALFKQALDFNPKNNLARSQLNKLNAPPAKVGRR